MNEDYDAIVIGAGIIGACIAYEFARAGRRTLVIEKNSTAGAGSTANSCAVIRTHYSTVDGAALALSNYPYWENWADYLGFGTDGRGCAPGPLARYREVGALFACYEENGYGQKLIDIAEELSIPYAIWTPAELRERIPIIDPGNFFPVKRPADPDFGRAAGDMRHVIHFPKVGFVSDPQLATQNVQWAAEAHGARFLFGTQVSEVARRDDRVAGVATAAGERFGAGVVVNAAGPHSHLINEMAGVAGQMKISTRALRVEVAHVPAPAGYDFEANGVIGSDSNIGGYYRPEVGNHILIGGEEPECDGLDWVDPDDYNTNLSEQARVQVLRAAQRFPTLAIPNQLKGIVDLYDVADDWIPIFDRSDLPGYYMAIGTSGNQFKTGPVVGMMMEELVVAVENGRDHDRDPLVYSLPNVDRELDLGFFSRLRKVNPDSSFSVVG